MTVLYRHHFQILLLLFFLPVLCFSQEQDSSLLLLKSGHRSVADNIDSLGKQAPKSSETFHGRYFRIIQFYNIPGAERRKEMEKHGIRFLDYLPQNAYFTAIHDSFNLQKLKDWEVRSIKRILPDYKISEKLKKRPFPDWAKTGKNKVKVVIKYYSVLEPNLVKESLKNHQYSIHNTYDYTNLITTSVQPAEIKALATFPFVQYMELPNPPAKPEDLPARTLHRSNQLASPHNNLSYNGRGVSVAIGDDGSVGPHIDYKGRLNQDSVSSDDGDHGDMVAGIFVGAGNINPTVKGMAYGADLFMYDVWRVIYSAPFHHNANDVKVTNTSYSNGCNDGYTSFTEVADQQINDFPTLMHVFSAGNDGNSNCGYGAGPGWGNVTGGIKIAKNVLCVANLDNEDTLAGSSSRGPAADGRIKPDISANGINQLSTEPPNDYDPGGGTSAAAPGIAGVTTQLIDAYRSMNGGADPSTSLIKATMLNTADDLGNRGPDFKFGWGRVNAKRALATLEDNRYLSDKLSNGGSNQHLIQVPSGTDQLRVMVYWLDPAASPSSSKALVNNLDISLFDPSGNSYLPWVLDESPNPSTLDDPATRGVDNLNNMEQVTLNNPTAGNYPLKVDATTVPKGPQKYFVVYEFRQNNIDVTYPNNNESLVPGTVEKIRWDAYGQSGPFTVNYSVDSGNTWQTIETGVTNGRGFVDWNVPLSITEDALIRVSNGNTVDKSDETFSIINQPHNLNISSACPSSFKLNWDAVQGANAYDVFLLGSKYMDSIGSTSKTSFTVQNIDPGKDYWLSVRAKQDNDLVGRRAPAIKKSPGLWNCPLPNDLAMEKFVVPGGNIAQDCHNLDSVNVKIKIRNPGTNSQSGFKVKYKFNNGPIAADTFQSTISPNGSAQHTFSNPLDINTTGNNTLTAWLELPNNNAAYNDTIRSTVRTINATTNSPPLTENFESFSTCGTSWNCGQEICNLKNGWVNANNGQEDDIDWRVDSAGTPSDFTGPSVDHNPGTVEGKYLYLEASNGCEGKEAKLLSPCIDLSGSSLPTLHFWYHMKGSDIGSLHVDVFTDGQWHENVMTPLIGPQSGNWHEETVSLTQFAGQVVTLRFRGITGDGFKSDITIDDISINEWTQSPVADFTIDNPATCTNTKRVLTNQSVGAANYTWSFSPSAPTYLNGTNANSTNPVIEFSNAGTYTVELVATNNAGQDTVVKKSHIEVDNVSNTPLKEDFQGSPALPSNWSIKNRDTSITWQEISNIIGIDGQSTQAMYMNCFNYDNAEGERDILRTEPVDVTGASAVELSFDVAYAPYSTKFDDQLVVEVSGDCGKTFSTVYDKEGANLATASDQSNSFRPSAANEWRSDTIMLRGLSSSAIIRFVSVNGYGNNIYLDNINLTKILKPSASFLAPNTPCKGDSLTVTSQASVTSNQLTFDWYFGSGAEPSSATGRGPHEVVYDSIGQFQIQSIVANNTGADTVRQQVAVQQEPVANFDYVVNQDTVTFTNQALHATDVRWHFGDGDFSLRANPSHLYQSNGAYDVEQIVSSKCGTDTTMQTITISSLSVEETKKDNIGRLKAYPNPNKGKFQIFVRDIREAVKGISIFDMRGRVVRKIPFSSFQPAYKDWAKTSVNLTSASKGIYFIQVTGNDTTTGKKIIIQ